MGTPGEVLHPLEVGTAGVRMGQEPSRLRPGLLVSHLRLGQSLSQLQSL